MKPSVIPAFLLLLLFSFPLLSQDGNADKLYEEGLRRYAATTGTVSYQITGDASGTVHYQFALAGWLEATVWDIEYELYGIKNRENRLEYRDGDTAYTINLTTLKGSRSDAVRESELIRYKSAEETREAIYRSQGGTKTGTTVLLDKEVVIWEFENTSLITIWEWNGLILKARRKIGKATYEYTAISLDLDGEVAIGLPENITFN
ncbi:MAG: hypothetical protein OEY56_14095 [Cyclobacteriaceae bacterium]|nr:hypothetical protein [Cyclobacteriaceae bacterium]